MRLRVALVCDLSEEQWPSMDLVAEMLADHLPRVEPGIEPTLLRPNWRRRATALPWLRGSTTAHALDRFSNRYLDYTWWLRARREDFDVFHVIDHSYAHLVHALPPHRTVVTCHDIDAFRCLGTGSRPLYRLAAKRLLSGIRQAQAVTCDTRATRDDLVRERLLPPGRLTVVHNGVHPAMFAGDDEGARAEIDRLAGPQRGPELLHVGSVIPRKRIDVLLRAFAGVRERCRTVRLLRAGGAMDPRQRALASQLGIAGEVVELPPLSTRTLAALYRRAALTVLPSDFEGFGLPLLESMASGTPVLASRVPALVEVGGSAASYAEPGNPAAWSEAIAGLLAEREQGAASWIRRRENGRRHAAAFTWLEHARGMVGVYRRLSTRGLGWETAAASLAAVGTDAKRR
jgi:glycosyltransferase involved in cell wall biosynthesis